VIIHKSFSKFRLFSKYERKYILNPHIFWLAIWTMYKKMAIFLDFYFFSILVKLWNLWLKFSEVGLVAKPIFFYWNLRWKLSPSYLCIHAWGFENLQNWRATHSKLLVEISAKIKQAMKRYYPFFFQKTLPIFLFLIKKIAMFLHIVQTSIQDIKRFLINLMCSF